MNRKSFLKKLGFGVGGSLVAPRLFSTAVTYKNEKDGIKVTPINSQQNPTEGLVSQPANKIESVCRNPCLGDECQDEKGNWWFVKGRENRVYGKYDWTKIIIIPLAEKRNKSGIYPNMQRVPIGWFHQRFSVKQCNTARKIAHENTR